MHDVPAPQIAAQKLLPLLSWTQHVFAATHVCVPLQPLYRAPSFALHTLAAIGVVPSAASAGAQAPVVHCVPVLQRQLTVDEFGKHAP